MFCLKFFSLINKRAVTWDNSHFYRVQTLIVISRPIIMRSDYLIMVNVAGNRYQDNDKGNITSYILKTNTYLITFTNIYNNKRMSNTVYLTCKIKLSTLDLIWLHNTWHVLYCSLLWLLWDKIKKKQTIHYNLIVDKKIHMHVTRGSLHNSQCI